MSLSPLAFKFKGKKSIPGHNSGVLGTSAFEFKSVGIKLLVTWPHVGKRTSGLFNASALLFLVSVSYMISYRNLPPSKNTLSDFCLSATLNFKQA